MIRKITIALLSMFIAALAFSAVLPEEEGYVIPHRISNNEFFLESIRLGMLALETYDFGDYDASTGFAEEAVRFAQLSNEFVAVQLIAEARRLLDWAQANSFSVRYPDDFKFSNAYYEVSVAALSNDNLELAIITAIASIEIIWRFEFSDEFVPSPVTQPASVVTPAPAPAPAPQRVDDGRSPLPSQYTVRTWANERDCLWNIAGYPWVYGDPHRWRMLYDANRSRLPDPGNPDLIHPGMVLDIPSIRGETRQGMWAPGRTYQPLP